MSPEYARGVVVSVCPDLNDFMVRSSIRMHGHPKGRQILTLYKFAQMATFSADCLKTVETPVNEYNVLRGRSRGAASSTADQ